MNEKQLNKSIRDTIESGVVPEVNMRGLAMTWFNGKPFTDKDMTQKLLRFSEKYGMDYVVILDGRQTIAVRFWLIKAKGYLDETISDTSTV